VKDFKTFSLNDIAAANVCTMKKTRGLYHVSERRYFNFSPGRFSDNGGYTYRAGCMLKNWQFLAPKNCIVLYFSVLLRK
jgi:hypothetical protein